MEALGIELKYVLTKWGSIHVDIRKKTANLLTCIYKITKYSSIMVLLMVITISHKNFVNYESTI